MRCGGSLCFQVLLADPASKGKMTCPVCVGKRADHDFSLSGRRVDELSVANVDAHMVDAAPGLRVEEQQIAFFKAAGAGDLGPGAHLAVSR